MKTREQKQLIAERKLQAELNDKTLLEKRNKIITELINSKLIEKYSKSVTFNGKYWREEFTQELYRMVCEIKPTKLIQLYETNVLYFYLIKCCKNQFFNKKSYFNRHINRVQFNELFKEYENKENTETDI